MKTPTTSQRHAVGRPQRQLRPRGRCTTSRRPCTHLTRQPRCIWLVRGQSRRHHCAARIAISAADPRRESRDGGDDDTLAPTASMQSRNPQETSTPHLRPMNTSWPPILMASESPSTSMEKRRPMRTTSMKQFDMETPRQILGIADSSYMGRLGKRIREATPRSRGWREHRSGAAGPLSVIEYRASDLDHRTGSITAAPEVASCGARSSVPRSSVSPKRRLGFPPC